MLYISSMGEKSFKNFLEEEENKSPYISSLEDEMGIDPRDIEKEPQVSSFFSLGGFTSNIGPYRIVRFKRNDDGRITHALVRRISDDSIRNRNYKDKEGKFTKTERPEEETFIVPVEDLDKLLSQSFQPPPAQGMM